MGGVSHSPAHGPHTPGPFPQGSYCQSRSHCSQSLHIDLRSIHLSRRQSQIPDDLKTVNLADDPTQTRPLHTEDCPLFVIIKGPPRRFDSERRFTVMGYFYPVGKRLPSRATSHPVSDGDERAAIRLDEI